MNQRYLIATRGMWVASIRRDGFALFTPRHRFALAFTRSTAAARLEGLALNFPEMVFVLEEAPPLEKKRRA